MGYVTAENGIYCGEGVTPAHSDECDQIPDELLGRYREKIVDLCGHGPVCTLCVTIRAQPGKILMTMKNRFFMSKVSIGWLF
jgi:hypothetical protein